MGVDCQRISRYKIFNIFRTLDKAASGKILESCSWGDFQGALVILGINETGESSERERERVENSWKITSGQVNSANKKPIP